MKHTNTYRRTLTDRILPDSLPGYVELVRVTLPEISKGTLNKSFLNNFKIGLDQYYLFRLYERLDSQLLTRTPSFKRIGHAVSLPNVTFDADTFFHDVQVHGFPSFEKHIYLYVEPSPNAEDQRFKVRIWRRFLQENFSMFILLPDRTKINCIRNLQYLIVYGKMERRNEWHILIKLRL